MGDHSLEIATYYDSDEGEPGEVVDVVEGEVIDAEVVDDRHWAAYSRGFQYEEIRDVPTDNMYLKATIPGEWMAGATSTQRQMLQAAMETLRMLSAPNGGSWPRSD